jgi:hypothetical protein
MINLVKSLPKLGGPTGFRLKKIPLGIYSLRENTSLPCVSNARQRSQSAWQSLCREFFSKSHGKGHTTDFYTAKALCRALFIALTAKALCRASKPAHSKIIGNGMADGSGCSPNSSPTVAVRLPIDAQQTKQRKTKNPKS